MDLARTNRLSIDYSTLLFLLFYYNDNIQAIEIQGVYGFFSCLVTGVIKKFLLSGTKGLKIEFKFILLSLFYSFHTPNENVVFTGGSGMNFWGWNFLLLIYQNYHSKEIIDQWFIERIISSLITLITLFFLQLMNFEDELFFKFSKLSIEGNYR